MRKRKLLPVSLALTLSLSLMLGGCNILQNPGNNTPETPSGSTVTSEVPDIENPSESLNSDWEKPSEIAEEELTAQCGSFVQYDGKILFRMYNDSSVDGIGLFGKFSEMGYPYLPNALYTFDPANPAGKAEYLCDDMGCDDLYLVGDTLYSMAANQDTSWRVTKRKLPDGDAVDICNGMMIGFSPDGKTFITGDYSGDYLDTGDGSAPDAYYTVRKTSDDTNGIGLFFHGDSNYGDFIGMDDKHAFFASYLADGGDYILYQFDYSGTCTALAKIDFDDTFSAAFEGKPVIQDDKISFTANSYEGTGGFYGGTAYIEVPVDPTDSGSADPLYEAKIEYYHPEDPNETPENKKVPEAISDYEIPYASNGSGFARVLQYFDELPEGYFFVMNDCHRDPQEDIGWREAYSYLNSRYFFMPQDSDDPIEIAASYAPAGTVNGIMDIDYRDMAPTLDVFAQFVGKPGEKPEGLLYETAVISGPEAPVEYSGFYCYAEFSDDLKYEHPVNGDIYEFTIDGMDELVKDYNVKEIYISSLPKMEEYLGYEVKGGFNFTNSCSIHIAFDEDGKINYIRPVIWD